MERKDFNSNNESLGDGRANGPQPCFVPTTAIAHTRQMIAEASRGPKRKATHTRNGVQRNVQGSFLTAECNNGPKTIPEMSSVEANSAAASTNCCLDQLRLGLAHHRSKKGAKTSAPAAAPSHQVRQIIPY